MSVLKIRDALLTVTKNVYHLAAGANLDRYFVWAEGPQGSAWWADNTVQNQTITGTIDYYTNTEYDADVDRLQLALCEADIPFRLSDAGYDIEKDRMHYQWQWSVTCGIGGIYS